MSENPTQTYPAITTPRPAATEAEDPHGVAAPAAVSREAATGPGLQWVPLLPGKASLALIALGVVTGIAGPVLLWLNFVVDREAASFQRVGFLLVIIGLGVVVIALTLLLAETARLERTSSIDAAGARPDSRADQARGLTGARAVALLGVVLILAGAFLVRPVEPAVGTSGGGGSSQGGGGNPGGGQGR